MVNKTDNNDPALKQQNEHQPAFAVNHVTQELHDTDALKEKLQKIYLTVITSTTLKGN